MTLVEIKYGSSEDKLTRLPRGVGLLAAILKNFGAVDR